MTTIKKSGWREVDEAETSAAERFAPPCKMPLNTLMTL